MGQALYRKYRSRSLDEIVGQSHITAILQRAITSGNVGHAYLLTGPKGVGKTSIARILAHEINKLPYSDESDHLDIIEIDAASNNSVEDVRDLRDKVRIAPSSAAYKIYIIDEVHMLSKQAFNALLKTLEEPPAHVIFILATTDADKLPATILSRVQRFNFRTIQPADAARHLRRIADEEKIAITDDALSLIAQHGRGSFRDSISLLDQLQHIASDMITPKDVEGVLGLASSALVSELLSAYDAGDLPTVVRLLDTAESQGTSAVQLIDQLSFYIREHILEEPHHLALLDRLLDARRSSWPDLKLLSTLAGTTPAVTPAATTIRTPAPAAQAPSSPAAAPVVPKTQPDVKPPSAPAEPTEPTPQTRASEFPWTDFLTELKSRAMGAHTLVNKCGHEFNGNTLTIFAGRSFTKKQIEKALPALREAMEAVGVSDAEISVSATAKPPKDSKTAEILAMMGGGEEVTL